MRERLRIAVPFTAPKPLQPSTSHLMSVRLEEADGGLCLSIDLWPAGVPSAAETLQGRAGTVAACIEAVAAAVRAPGGDGASPLLHDAGLADLVAKSLRRALLASEGGTDDSMQLAARAVERSAGEVQRVLLVEANDVERAQAELALGSVGFDVRAVASLQEALEACRVVPYDVAVVDAQLADGPGEAGRIRAATAAKLLILSRDPAAIDPVLRDAHVLRKPFTRAELVTAVAAMGARAEPPAGA